MKDRKDYTEAERGAFDAGFDAAYTEIVGQQRDLSEVRKIACALIAYSAESNQGEIAARAWAIWRAIKAGQEGKP